MIFFISFRAKPTEQNPQYELIDSVYAACWIAEENEIAAFNKAHFFVSKDEWEIESVEKPATKVSAADFVHREIALEEYRKAEAGGVAIFYAGWARDGKTATGPFPFKSPAGIDLNAFISNQKKIAKRGKCLHFESGPHCSDFIEAHSIQKRGQLSLIANLGHVYVISPDIGTLKKNDGRFVLEKRGIGKVSTFLGFCGYHDNRLFASIDSDPLSPTPEQVSLYAYRSICRELLVKENAFDLIDSQLAQLSSTSAKRSFFNHVKLGTTIGLDDLRQHKAAFDASLRGGHHGDIEYVLFVSRKPLSIAFSGLFFPEYDFLARRLQNLLDVRRPLDLLTMCSAPMANGWGFLFAWHKTSSRTCKEFMSSLATLLHERQSSAADAMFRLAVSNCENFACSPAWWESLPEKKQNAVRTHISNMANLFDPTNPSYLTSGLDGICNWEFDLVYQSPE